MTEHDLKVCLRCGQPAGDHRFCESCRSSLDSFWVSVGDARERAEAVCPAAHAAETGPGQAHSGHGFRIIAGGSGPAVGPDADAPPKVTISGDERSQAPTEVARFEDVMTPKSTDVDRALAAFRRGDAAGNAKASVNLGVLLEQRGEREDALAAYRRADERGDLNGTFNLGCLLAEMGDMPGALEALRRADERGDGAAASNLGVLLERQGKLDDALEAYRRADERGDMNGAFNLGLLLARRGGLADARAAYQRAAERANQELAAGGKLDEPNRTAIESAAAESPETPPIEDEPRPAPPQPSAQKTSRPTWVTVLCLLTLLGLAVGVARRRARGRRRRRR